MSDVNNAQPNNDDESANLARLMQAAVANAMVSGGGPSDETVTKVAVLNVLAHLGGGLMQEDALKFSGNEFIIPTQYNGRLAEAAAFLLSWSEQQEAEMDMKRSFPYRPYDVAHAAQATMKKLFGTTGTGQAIQSLFGSIPPEFISVPTGVDQTTQVPWNKVKFDIINGSIFIGATRSSNGPVGELTVTAARKYRSVIEGFFTAVEAELKENSIYRGKAVVNGRWDEIQFLDLSKVRRQDVIYGDQVMRELEAHLWVPIRHTEEMRKMGQPVKRAVLLEGPYGTGKSLAGYLTAQECVANGWTFIFVKPGDDLNEAMQTAKLYSPSCVFFEDIDVLQSNDPEAVSKLLDSFDGISGKGQEVIAVLTTNNREKIHKGMLRPGRLDALIHIAELDQNGVAKLIKASTPAEYLDDDINWGDVFVACHGYLPAFVREVAARAFRFAMAREGGKPAKLFTEDFEAAAHSLREQFNLMTGAYEVQPEEGLNKAFEAAIQGVFKSAKVLDRYGDPSDEIGEFVFDKK
jgi:transitional endoplasmic reticulum ATPase